MAIVDTSHILIDPEVLGGEPHIEGRRISVADIAVWIAYEGRSPSDVAATFHLTLGEVYSALAYYYDHQTEIDRDIRDADRQAQEMAERFPKGWRPGETGDQARFLRFIAETETETASSMQGRIRFYEPIPRGMFPDDQ